MTYLELMSTRMGDLSDMALNEHQPALQRVQAYEALCARVHECEERWTFYSQATRLAVLAALALEPTDFTAA